MQLLGVVLRHCFQEPWSPLYDWPSINYVLAEDG